MAMRVNITALAEANQIIFNGTTRLGLLCLEQYKYSDHRRHHVHSFHSFLFFLPVP
jgi:hypothetical protein